MTDEQTGTMRDFVLLHRVAQRINSNLDLDSLLAEIVNDISDTFGCSRSAVLLKDDATDELVVGADCGGDMNLHLKGDRFKIGQYGMVGHVGAIGETYYAPDVSVDPYYLVSDSQTRSEVDIPLSSHGHLIGVFNAQHKEVNGFSPDRIELLEALAGHIATAIENARMFQKERSEKERMAKELMEARRIQQSLFPGETPSISGFNINGACLPCLEVGGDWYDYIPLQDGRLAIVLADVSGKGMGAAMLMSSTRTVLRLVAENGTSSPAEVLCRVNRVLLRDFPSAKFVTMVFAILDPRRETIVFANAGHCPPILVSMSGAEPLLTDVGLPLGIQESSFSERTVVMTEGTKLVVYSDGLTEAMSPSMEQYGERRLTDYLTHQSPSVENLLEDVRKFRNGHSISDDLTVVMIESKQ